MVVAAPTLLGMGSSQQEETFQLKPEEELRLEVGSEKKATVTLLEGTAEVRQRLQKLARFLQSSSTTCGGHLMRCVL